MPWKVCSEPFLNAHISFPTQQRDVNKVIDTLSAFPEVRSIVVFGGSVTCICNPWSDLDLFVDCPIGFQRPPVRTEAALDFGTPETVDANLMREILQKGVVVYEQ